MQKEFKDKTITQLRKTQGMISKVIEMAESDRYCIDLLQQSLAAMGLLKGVNKLILENHFSSCFKTGMQTSSSKKQKELIKEVIQVISKV